MLRNIAQMDSELEEATFASCQVLQQLLTSFLTITAAEPSELDMIHYQKLLY